MLGHERAHIALWARAPRSWHQARRGRSRPSRRRPGSITTRSGFALANDSLDSRELVPGALQLLGHDHLAVLDADLGTRPRSARCRRPRAGWWTASARGPSQQRRRLLAGLAAEVAGDDLADHEAERRAPPPWAPYDRLPGSAIERHFSAARPRRPAPGGRRAPSRRGRQDVLGRRASERSRMAGRRPGDAGEQGGDAEVERPARSAARSRASSVPRSAAMTTRLSANGTAPSRSTTATAPSRAPRRRGSSRSPRPAAAGGVDVERLGGGAQRSSRRRRARSRRPTRAPRRRWRRRAARPSRARSWSRP